ncbi:DUF2393 family protein [Hydrogenimonas sp.]
MAEYLRSYLFYSLHSLTKYDYMAIGWILFLSLLFLVLAAVVKRRTLSYMLLFLGIFLLFVGPVAVKSILDRYLRAAEAQAEQTKLLTYSQSLLIEGSIKNSGDLDFDHCDLALLIYRPESNFLKRVAAQLKPITVRIEPLDFRLAKGESKPFRIIVDHFNTHDFNLSLQPRCYP